MEYLKELTEVETELVPDNWILVRERAQTTGLCSKGGILNTRVSVEERSCREGV